MTIGVQGEWGVGKTSLGKSIARCMGSSEASSGGASSGAARDDVALLEAACSIDFFFLAGVLCLLHESRSLAHAMISPLTSHTLLSRHVHGLSPRTAWEGVGRHTRRLPSLPKLELTLVLWRSSGGSTLKHHTHRHTTVTPLPRETT